MGALVALHIFINIWKTWDRPRDTSEKDFVPTNTTFSFGLLIK